MADHCTRAAIATRLGTTPGARSERRCHAGGPALIERVLLVLLLLLAAVATPGLGFAASCGGMTRCMCGDTVIADTELPSDLGPCPGHGLIVRSKTRLDCHGHRVIGLGNGSEQFGIFLDGKKGAEVTGATVKGCEVSRFLRGIRLRSASSNVIAGNTASGNGNHSTHVGYGIDVSGASANNALEDNRVFGNADEGVHIGYGSHRNRLVGNVIHDNFRENLYVLGADGGVFLRNTLGGGGVNSLYLKDSSFNRFEGNTFRGKTARVIGDAHDNQFIDNAFTGAGLHFVNYKSHPPRFPTRNRVTGGSITDTPDCVRFTSSSGNVLADVAFGDCRVPVRAESPEGPAANTIIGPPPAAAALDDGSALSLGWRVVVQVRDADGAPVPGAQVEARDAAGNAVWSATTDAGGAIPTQIGIATERAGTQTVARSPLTIAVSKAGYAPETRTVPIGNHLQLTIPLSKP